MVCCQPYYRRTTATGQADTAEVGEEIKTAWVQRGRSLGKCSCLLLYTYEADLLCSWFGKNSTQGRLQRALTEIQIRMRLKVSGDRREIRQSYIPTLYHTLVEPLAEEGNEAIEGIIDGMDQYYLTKEEWDALVELGIGDHAGEPILKKIKPATKTAFTRKYNTGDHPIPSHKATEIAGAKRMAAETQKPDLEEAFDVEVAADDDEDTKPKKAGEADTIKDKLVKAKKPKAEKKTAVKKEPGVKGKK